jgi:membrane-associated phospholipid phosphatase
MRRYVFVDYATQGYSALVLLLILFFHNHTVPNWQLLLAIHAAGLVLVDALIRWHALRPLNKTLDFLRHFYPVLLYTAFFCETAQLNRMFFTDYLDPVMRRWDQALFGSQPGLVLMPQMPWLLLSELLFAAYFSYYVMIGGIGLALFLRDRRQFFHYVSVVSFVFYVCYFLYIVFPVAGPIDSVNAADYPVGVTKGPFFHLMAWIYRVFESPGAAIPSSHVAIALTTLYFSFLYLPRLRFIHLPLAVLLCASTVYCHYHYAVDVVAGICTAVILIPVGNWLYSRFQTPKRVNAGA